MRLNIRALTKPWKIGRNFVDFWEESMRQNLRELFLLLNIEENDFVLNSKQEESRPLLPCLLLVTAQKCRSEFNCSHSRQMDYIVTIVY